MSRRPDLEVDIGELVLHGFAPAHRRRIAAAVERELGARLAAAADPLAPAHRTVGSIDAGSVQLAAGASPEAIGSSIGARLAASLGPGGNRGR